VKESALLNGGRLGSEISQNNAIARLSNVKPLNEHRSKTGKKYTCLSEEQA